MKTRRALAVAFTLSLPLPAHAGEVTPPAVPDKLQVPEGAEAFLIGHARGTQNYVCLATASGFAWTLFTPDATLFKDERQADHHPLLQAQPVRAQHESEGGGQWHDPRGVAALDTSTVWAGTTPAQTATTATDPDFVKPGAVAWLLLTVAGAQDGPNGGDTLTNTTFIQRVNTEGGLAPSTGCAQLEDVGKQAFMPYRADYVFYEGPEGAKTCH